MSDRKQLGQYERIASRDALDVETLRSVKILRRPDGRGWRETLEPILRDTVGIEPATPHSLGQIERGVSILLDELARYPMPQYLVNTGPEDRYRVNPTVFASALVGHRAELLVQTAELTAGALDALECGALQLSAVAARAQFELSVVCWDIHQRLLEPWRAVHGSIKRVRAEANSDESVTFRLLWNTRMGSRTYDTSEGWPQATGMGNRIARFNRGVTSAQEIYDMLCEATHPNIESHAALWRTEYLAIGEHRAIRFAPGKSNSTIKMAIIDALFVSLGTMIPFVRDLWWMAADITNTCDTSANRMTQILGLPVRMRRDEPCSCGSGLRTRECDHPEPQFRPEIELGED